MAYHCTNIKTTKGEQSSVSVEATIPAEAMQNYREIALKELGKNIKIDGFREGHVPKDVLEQRIGEAAIMQEAAEKAIADQYPQLIDAEKLQLIGRPNVAVSKLSKEDGMQFTIEGTLLPEVKLPDYQSIAKKHLDKKEEQTVDENEVNETLTHLRRERAKIEKIESGSTPEDAAKEVAEMDALSLPALDDSFVQTLGYKDVEDFTSKLRENIVNEKNNREREKSRIAIIEEIIKETKLEVPDTLVDAELQNMESQFAHDLSHNGMTLDQYLSETKKTKEDLHKEWKEGARKRAAMQLITREIAEKEDIKPDEVQVSSEVEHVLSHTQGADPTSVRAYVTNALRTEMVFRFLEEQK